MRCMVCGSEVDEGTAYCPVCGFNLVMTEDERERRRAEAMERDLAGEQYLSGVRSGDTRSGGLYADEATWVDEDANTVLVTPPIDSGSPDDEDFKARLKADTQAWQRNAGGPHTSTTVANTVGGAAGGTDRPTDVVKYVLAGCCLGLAILLCVVIVANGFPIGASSEEQGYSAADTDVPEPEPEPEPEQEPDSDPVLIPVEPPQEEPVIEEEDSNIYELTVRAKDGSQLSGTVRRDDYDYVIADSSEREYSVSELRNLNLSDAELCIAWNEPFARLGYHFSNSGLQRYFESCSWYSDGNRTFSITGVGATNNSRLRQIAKESSSSSRWIELAAN